MENGVEKQALTDNVNRDFMEDGKLNAHAAAWQTAQSGPGVVNRLYGHENKQFGPIMLHTFVFFWKHQKDQDDTDAAILHTSAQFIKFSVLRHIFSNRVHLFL